MTHNCKGDNSTYLAVSPFVDAIPCRPAVLHVTLVRAVVGEGNDTVAMCHTDDVAAYAHEGRTTAQGVTAMRSVERTSWAEAAAACTATRTGYAQNLPPIE